MANKPTVVANWADSGSVVDPGAVKRDLGWIASEAPPFDFFNYLHNASGQWMTWLDEQFEDGPVADDLRINPPGVLYLKSRFAVASSQSVVIEVDTPDGGTSDPSALIIDNDETDAVTSFLMRTDGDELFEIRTDHDAFDTLFYNDSNAQPSMVLSGDNVLIGKVGQGNKLQIPSGNSHEIFGTFDVTENGTTDFSKAADPSLTNGALWLRDGFIKTSDGTNTFSTLQRVQAITSSTVFNNVVNGVPGETVMYSFPANMLEVGSVFHIRMGVSVQAVAVTGVFTANLFIGDGSTDEVLQVSKSAVIIGDLYYFNVCCTVRAISATVGQITMSGEAKSADLVLGNVENSSIRSDVSTATMDTTNLQIKAQVFTTGGGDADFEISTFVVEVSR